MTWTLQYDSYEPLSQAHREALCTLGNGYFATRGAGPETRADNINYPATYIAGCYNRLTSEIAGRSIENEDLVNVPNWLPLTFRLDGGDWFSLERANIEAFHQSLDMKRGVLERRIVFNDRQDRRTELSERRFVHMKDPHIAGLELTLTPLNWAGHFEVRTAIDASIENSGVARYRDLEKRHWQPRSAESSGVDTLVLVARTSQSWIEVAVAARTRVFRDGTPETVARDEMISADQAAQTFGLFAEANEPVRIEKIIALYTSRDHAIANPRVAAINSLNRAPDFTTLLAAHEETWAALWRLFRVTLDEGEEEDEADVVRALRLHLFHLLQTTSPHTIDLDVGAPARGLHGEAYRGHVFWDELFIFPILSFRMPEITRALLLYRYRRLDEARAAAHDAGYRGAMYPWQSGSDGREESQRLHLNPRSGRWLPDNSALQRHVNAAIAYNIWHYYQVTTDMHFLAAYGAEMMLEIARFWASMATYDSARERYRIIGVMGPDEYHDAYPWARKPGLDNNAYTNFMAAWVLRRTLDLPQHLPADEWRRLRRRLHVSDEELRHWDDVSRRLFLPFHDGVISQFEGYEQLSELDWDGLKSTHGDIQRLDRILEAAGDTPNSYKASKQADVLMIFYLFSAEEIADAFKRLGYRYDPRMIPRTIEYYMARTSHGSTLSRIVHSWVLARSQRERSWSLFREALDSDIRDIQGGTTAEGIHLGAMAGTVDIVQRCYTGLAVRNDALWFHPVLPEHVTRVSFRIGFRGHGLEVEITPGEITVTATPSPAPPVRIGLEGTLHTIRGGESCRCPIGEHA